MTGAMRWGILGAGSMAARFARDLSYSEHGQLVAIASRNPQRAAQMVQAPGIARHGARAFANYAALVADDSVDAVYIATPPKLHREHALLAIAAGKAVLCEKPLAASVEDAQAIAKAAHAANVFCMEALWTRFLPAFIAVERQIKSLGPLRQINAQLGFPRIARAGDPVTDMGLGGGALNDLGVYPLALASVLAGPLRLVSCYVTRGDGLVDTIRDAAALLVADESGVIVSMSVSHATHFSNRFEIIGEAGRMTIDAPFIEALGLRHVPIAAMDHRSGDTSGRVAVALKGGRLWPLLRGARRHLRHPDGPHSSYGYRGTGLQFQADEVARCLNCNLIASPLFSLDTSLDVYSLVAQIEISAPPAQVSDDSPAHST
ncbi:MAG: Gfo/Idh/MocA family oxidoreductase [Alphaproteobacteria bacterium]|nr:Gfo/Idh/MocA family oxidoreductase [Alphaproteobacteria bacterium]MBU1834491.1 Gfo/Idh/MocA family oxidoreductase [Alphaproteobacteria bacterium]